MSRFGKPYPPFDFNSGMGIEDVSRDDAIKYNLIEDNEDVLPNNKAYDYEFSASVANVDTELLEALEKKLDNKFGIYAVKTDDGIRYESLRGGQLSPQKVAKNI